jgi:glycosyltransferase involved in cell wall biosynthesis
MVRISVVIPALNEEKNIAKCLRSIREQDFEDFEIILADGYSRDRTVQIARKYCDKIIRDRARSAAAERQAGARIARGDIIAFMDADSFASPDWLARINEAFSRGDTAGAYGKVLLHDGSSLDRWACKHLFNGYLWFASVVGRPAASGMNMAVRRSAFRKAGGFNTKLVTGEDVDLFHRLKHYGKIRFCNAEVYTSARRIQKWGYLKFFAFHLTNLLSYNISGKTHAEYEIVR